jgi:undecaprenyl-diphosphatase
MLINLLDVDRYILSFFNGSESVFVDGVVTILTSGFTWVLLYLVLFYIVIKNNDTMSQIGITIGCVLLCLLFADGLADGIVKPLVARPRPLNDPFIKHTIDIVAGSYDRQYSFFSAHAANTFSLAIFFSLHFRRKAITVVLVAWSLLNCWTRLYMGMHYPSDIVVGLLWGFCVGGGVWSLFRRRLKSGSVSHDGDLLITAFVFTLLMAVLMSFFRLL